MWNALKIPDNEKFMVIFLETRLLLFLSKNHYFHEMNWKNIKWQITHVRFWLT